MAISVVLLSIAFTLKTEAAQTIPYKVNFQGKLTTSAGAPVADGLYNMQFRLYDALTSGSQLWIESREAANRVQVTNGLFSVQLGDVAALSPTLFSTSSPRYFEVTQATPATANCSVDFCAVWESPMTPRNPLGAAAYAFNADTIDGIDGASLAQLGLGNTFTGANTFSGTSGFSNAVDINSSSASAFTVRNSTTNLFSANASTSRVNIGAGESSDATAIALVLDTKNTSGDPTGVNGAMYYNSNAGMFRCYEAGVWKNCITSAGGSPTLQDVYNNSTAPATITTTAAGKTVKIAAGAAPNTDMLTITNVGQVVNTTDANGIEVEYYGGTTASIEGAGINVDYYPGSGSGSIWNGLKIVSGNSTASTTNYGIQIVGPTTGSGTDVGLRVASGFDIGIDIANGGLQLSSAQGELTAPAAGSGLLKLYAKTNAGRTMLKTVGGSGIDITLQPFFGTNKIGVFQPAGGTASCTGSLVGQTFGLFPGTTNYSGTTASNGTPGTACVRAPATTNLFQSMRRAGFVTSTATGTTAGFRGSSNQNMYWRGNAAGQGGFYFIARYGVSAVQTGMKQFAGMMNLATLPGNFEPSSSSFLNIVGFGCDSTDTVMQLIYNDGSGTATKVSMGANFPCTVANTNMYEIRLFSSPNGSEIYYSIAKLNGTDFTEGSINTDIPSNTTMLNPQIWVNNGSAVAAAGIDISSVYIETDN